MFVCSSAVLLQADTSSQAPEEGVHLLGHNLKMVLLKLNWCLCCSLFVEQPQFTSTPAGAGARQAFGPLTNQQNVQQVSVPCVCVCLRTYVHGVHV